MCIFHCVPLLHYGIYTINAVVEDINMVMIKIMLHVSVVASPIDVAFPYFHGVIALTSQIFDLFHCGTMEFLHGFAADQVHGIVGVTSGTSVPKTAVDFIRSMGFLMVAVEQIGTNTFLATVTRVLNMGFVLFGCVREPFMGKQRLVVLWAISQRRNDGDRTLGR